MIGQAGLDRQRNQSSDYRRGIRGRQNGLVLIRQLKAWRDQHNTVALHRDLETVRFLPGAPIS
jgi:hypothetical protein